MIEDALWREATGRAPAEIDVHTRFGVTRDAGRALTVSHVDIRAARIALTDA
jgi:hypothetical protein